MFKLKLKNLLPIKAGMYFRYKNIEQDSISNNYYYIDSFGERKNDKFFLCKWKEVEVETNHPDSVHEIRVSIDKFLFHYKEGRYLIVDKADVPEKLIIG